MLGMAERSGGRPASRAARRVERPGARSAWLWQNMENVRSEGAMSKRHLTAVSIYAGVPLAILVMMTMVGETKTAGIVHGVVILYLLCSRPT